MTENLKSKKLHRQMEIQNKIFDTTMELIRENGYGDVTVRTICERAGISIGMFYRNFNSRDDVITYFYTRTAKTYEEKLLSSLEGMPIKEQLINFYTWVAKFTGSFGLDFVALFLRMNKPGVKSDFMDNEVVAIGRELLDSAVERREIVLPEGRDSFDVTHDILIINKGIVLDWCITNGAYDIAEYTNSFLKRTISSLLG
ncbi:TetR/AcrR family transcriptional regulator [Cloacibacillus evryensis]|uniref:TetR/AcrR family transcriptional regulator n=1 Tax=Cloacibacillus evryensis TaxID=508460 RepID=UPI002108A974|nr:TetR/AcrR family transcriptional regulator [Cloacibacillus evryensis]MCQ4764914.1 TetR/AcrR family transcriptional regulator [Cloacibacillus evryensis]